MTEIFIGSSLRYPEAQKINPNVAVIGFSGAFAGGSNTSQYTDKLTSEFGDKNVLLVPSVSTKYAFDNGSKLSAKTYNNNEYYRALASTAIEKFSNHDTFLIHCQSGGGIEGLAFTRALLTNDRLRAKKIKLLFSGVPGFSEKNATSVGRAFTLLKNFIDMGIHREDYQHFDLCPPPEEYFTYIKNHQQQTFPKQTSGIDIVYKDTPATRGERRNTFYTKYTSFLQPQERQAVTEEIKTLDDSIKKSLARNDKKTEQDINRLLHQRAKRIFSIGGDRYYNEYLAHKPEYKNVPTHGLDGTIVGALYLTRLFASVGKGMETKLADIIQLAEKKHIKIDFSFGLFEKDKFMSLQDIPSATARLSKADITQNLSNWLVVEGLSHESVDNSPQGIFNAIMKLHAS